MSGVLDGLVVLDLTRFLSGPYCTLLLAGLGAEVIKIDDPAGGDPTAGAPPFASVDGIGFERRDESDLGIAYLKRARGKRSMTINLKDARGRELLLRLAGQADVVVENFRPGVSARLGIDYPVLQQHNARLVHCAITGYGATGPDRLLKAYDLMAQAASGLMGITGEPDGPPMKIGSAFSDMLAGTYAALAIVAAVHERARSGCGQSVDVSMVDCLFSMMMDEPLDCYERLGLPVRQGNRIMRFSPFNTYRARDGWVAVGVATRSEWQRLAVAMDREDLSAHRDFAQVQWRIQNNEQVDRVLGEWVAGLTVAGVVERLGAADVACTPVRTPADALAWPQLRERGMVNTLRLPDGSATGAFAAGLPFRYSRSASEHVRPAPVPGGDTQTLLASLLGLSDDEFASLRRDGVV